MRHWCKTDSVAYSSKLKMRFDQKCQPVKSGCIEWVGSMIGHYGQIKVKNRNTLAHRVAMLLAGHIIDNHVDVLHYCDNGRCVNVEHLFIGTHDENMADKAKKGRAPRKLFVSQVKDIKQRLAIGTSCNSIAVLYSVSPHTIADIRDNVTWKHVTT